MSTELVGNVDVSRGFKEKEDASLFGMAARFINQAKQASPFSQELPKWGSVSLYTYGAPRVGNSEFARFFEELFAGREAFRVVNDRDIVHASARRRRRRGRPRCSTWADSLGSREGLEAAG